MRKSSLSSHPLRKQGVKRISDKKLRALGGKMPFSTITSKPKPIRKENPVAKAKRKKGYQKMLRSKEYKAARAEAMLRAGKQCEVWLSTETYPSYGPIMIPPYTAGNTVTTHVWRCEATEDLEAHHLRYPKGRKIEGRDLTIACKPHHDYLESLKPHKRYRRAS